MAQQFLDLTGLNAFWLKIKNYLNTNYVVKVDGKGLSTNDYTDADKGKLAVIESGAQVNVIETVKLGGTALEVTDKAVDIPVDDSLKSDSKNPVQNKVVYTAISTLATEVDTKVDAASGDAYYTLTKNGTSITGAATTALTDAIGKANSALQSTDITTGSSNGTISVGGSDVAVKGLGSAAYTESGAYAPSTLSGTVTEIGGRVDTLEGKVANLASATSFLGITTTELTDDATTSTVKIDSKDVTAQKGDVVIYDNSEFIWTGSKWEKLGDTTAEAQRITNIENAYVSTFGGAKGAITLDTEATAIGAVDFAMSGNKLTGTVNVGTTSFGGKTGAITLNTGSTTVGTVNFVMSDNKLTGTVVPQTLPTGSDLVTVADSDTIDFKTSTTDGKLSISGDVKTDGLNDYVDGRITTKINGLNVTAPTAGTGDVTVVVTGVTQTSGKIAPVYTSFSAIPTSAIEALS